MEAGHWLKPMNEASPERICSILSISAIKERNQSCHSPKICFRSECMLRSDYTDQSSRAYLTENSMRRSIPLLAIGFTLLAVVLLAANVGKPITGQPNAHEELLKVSVDLQEFISAEAVADYVPTSNIQIFDLNSPVDELLRSLPGVVQVEALVKADKLTHRIIHLRDWHFISKELFNLDMRKVHGRQLSESAIDRLYREFLLEVELVQIDQWPSFVVSSNIMV